jgi:hypothetical protein
MFSNAEFTTDRTLWAGSFKEIEGIKRRYSLPAQLADYNQAIEQILERSNIYRRSTAYFDSGVLKLYEEPLKSIMRTEGKIRLLMDYNFTRAAHSRNAESLTFFKSWEGNDRKTIIDSIHDFDREWSKEDISFDLTQTFLQQVLLERDRRIQQNQPQIETIAPTELPPGETTSVTITGTNLDTVETIDLPDNDLIQIDIIDRTPTQIDAEVTISPQYPPQAITGIRVRDRQGNDYNATPTHPPQVKNTQQLPDLEQIESFRAAAELILR